MDEIRQSLVLRSRTDYDRSVRRSAVVVGVFLLFHLTTLSDFLALHREQKQLEEREEDLAKLKEKLNQLETEMSAFEETTSEALDKVLQHDLKQRLISDFTQFSVGLSDILDSERGEPERRSPAEPASGARPRSFMPLQEGRERAWRSRAQMAILHGLEGLGELPREIKLSPKEIKGLQEAWKHKNTARMRAALEEPIQKEIIAPRFDQATEEWQEEYAPELRSQVTQLRQLVDQTRRSPNNSLLPTEEPAEPSAPEPTREAPPLWEKLDKALEGIEGTLTTMQFKPPEGKSWWRTRESKGRTIDILESEAADRLVVQGGKDVEDLRAQIDRINEEVAAASRRVSDGIRQTRIGFENLLRSLSSLGMPFSFVSVRLDALVERFTLLLGLGLGIAIFRPANRLWKLGCSYELLAADEKNALAWSLVSATARAGKLLFWVAVVTGLTVGWIVFSHWQIATAELPNVHLTRTSTGVGIVAVVAAFCYWLYRLIDLPRANRTPDTRPSQDAHGS